jgi:1-acyl-sn-glycerol-3-phosphate acyltransferase
MSLAQGTVAITFRLLTSLICQIDDSQLGKVPDKGPLIIVTNHTNVLEVPIIYTRLQPRLVTGFVAAERWEHTWSRWLLDACQAVPVRRGEPDVTAIRRGLDLLKKGYFVIVMPEGTRSGDGRMQQGHPGVVLLGLNSGAPLLPVAFYGGEDYKENLRRLRRTDFHLAVGRPFYLDPGGEKVTRPVRRLMVDEVMFQVARLLPEGNRGVYAGVEGATSKYLRFLS